MPRTISYCTFAAGVLLLWPGCHHLTPGQWVHMGQVPHEGLQNPLPVPLVAREVVMDEVSDELDNYFRILREQRVQLIDSVLTEGWIETEPRIGSTILEPWRSDSTRGFERAHASLQTVRRWAKVRVIPAGDRYLIDVMVHKELEDLAQPLKSSIGGQLIRHDNSLDIDRIDVDAAPVNRGWIPMGRDFSLEQQILTNIQSRLHQSMQADSQQPRLH